jgi:glycosyltransferase involved in cell wall biosynthesis
MDPLVSILIPAYNAGPFIGDCIESARRQAYTNCEIIVVDDGSTDDTASIARRFPDLCRVIQQVNQGQAGALNTAMGAAQGDYFQFLDADDLLHPDKIRIQVERLSRDEPNCVATGAWARFRESFAEGQFVPEGIWRDLRPSEWLIRSWQGEGMMHVAAWLIPRAVADAAGNWDASLTLAMNLDADFFTRALLQSKGCLFCADAKSYYRSGHFSMSRWRSRETQEATFLLLKKTGAALLEEEDSAGARRAFATNVQRFVYATYPEHPDLVDEAENLIARLGGSPLEIEGGTLFLTLANMLGWKAAKRIRNSLNPLRRDARSPTS